MGRYIKNSPYSSIRWEVTYWLPVQCWSNGLTFEPPLESAVTSLRCAAFCVHVSATISELKSSALPFSALKGMLSSIQFHLSTISAPKSGTSPIASLKVSRGHKGMIGACSNFSIRIRSGSNTISALKSSSHSPLPTCRTQLP